jgi:hypothetical protein
VKVELLYFDGCPNWMVADERLHAALEAVGQDTLQVERVLVTTPEDAEQRRFVGSPTVLIDGRDPFGEGALPVGLTCRLYRTPTGSSGAPTVEQLIEALTS